MNKKHLTILLASFLCLVLMAACSQSNETNLSPEAEKTQVPTASSEEKTAPASESRQPDTSVTASESEAPVTTEEQVETPYTLDRNQVTIRPEEYGDYIADGIYYDLLFGNRIPDDHFEDGPEPREIKVYQYDVGEVFRNESYKYKFSVSGLPAYEKEKEESYCFSGSRISFVIPNMTDGGPYPELVKGRCVTDEKEHRFVVKTIAQARYVPYEAETDGRNIRLIVCIRNDSGILDTFLVDQDFHLLHLEGEITEESFDHPLPVTDISVDPLSPKSYLYLTALAGHYVFGEKTSSKDVFCLYRHFNNQGYELKSVIHEAFERAVLQLEYKGKSVQIDAEEDFERFLMIFSKDLEWQFTSPALWSSAEGLPLGEDSLKVSLLKKEGEDLPDRITSFFVSPEGKIYLFADVLAYQSGYSWSGYGTLNMNTQIRTDFIYQFNDTYSFDELMGFMK